MLNTVKTIVLASVFSLLNINLVAAQITPDNTLGSENSRVTQGNINGLSSDIIDQGAIRGGNLFHSFSEFNVNEGRGAYFQNPTGIDNILSRVTGSNISNINGTLGVLGDANLFLINPHGIVFGANAKLDLNGSFLASTADSIIFNHYKFSTTEKNPPPDALLTINIPLGLQFNNNQSKLEINTTTEEFKVKPQQFLTLIGGDIEFNNAKILSPDSNINLGGLLGAGEITLTGFIPTFPNNITRGNITLNGASINVRDNGNGLGGININTHNLELIESSGIRAGIGANMGDIDITAGNINVNATGNITLSGKGNNPSIIANQVRENGKGNAGNINITANNINLNHSLVSTINLGTGNGGNINLNITDTAHFEDSDIYSTLESTGEGNAGNINIITSNLILKSTDLDTYNKGKGDSGNIDISANTIAADHSNLNTYNDRYGNSGIVTIKTTGSVTFDNSSEIDTYTFNKAKKSGDITIEAESFSLLNHSDLNANIFDLYNSDQKEEDATNITIKTKDFVTLNNESEITAFSFGNPVNFLIETGKLTLTNSSLNATISGDQNGGNLIINTTDSVELTGKFTTPGLKMMTNGDGNAGNIEVNTNQLIIKDGTSISTQTLGDGKGNGGNIIINATELVSLSGISGDGDYTEINSSTGNQGKGGDITINTQNLSLQDGSKIVSETTNIGNAGNLEINASEIELIGGANINNPTTFSTETLGEGNAGNININTNSLLLKDYAELNSSTLDVGNAGNITINTHNLSLENQGKINSETKGNGDAGNITINSHNLILDWFSSFSSETLGKGNAGNIFIKNTGPISLNLSEISSAVSLNATGNAGDIKIDTKNISFEYFSFLKTLTSGEGTAGDLIINASEFVNILNFSFLFAQTNSNFDAGNIIINSPQFFIDSGSQVSAFTTNSGNAGNITINSPEFVDIGKNSKINVETSAAGSPGDINIITDRLNIGENAQLSATATVTSTNLAGGGSINLDVNDLNISGKLGIFAETNSATPAGDLTIKPINPDLNINFTENGFISASTKAIGSGGNITINAPETITIQGLGKISVETSGQGNAGNINLESKNLNIADQTEISASTTGAGNAGNININVENLNLTGNAKIISDTFSSGDSGNINIKVTDNFTLNDSLIAASTAENSTGKGGSIFIDPNTVNLNNSTIAVSSQGLGIGGNIELTANTLNLNNSAISAETNSADGGSITLNISDQLNFLNSSEITATAGKAQGAGNGGNINLFADYIINYPTENNNQITANAFEGNGGNINITTNGIFGSQYLDITASSQFGLDGEININLLKGDPTGGLFVNNKPDIDIAALFAKNFCNVVGDSSFVYIGRAGRVLTQNDEFEDYQTFLNWVDNPYSNKNTVGWASPTIPAEKSEEIIEIVQTQGWLKLPDGTIVLTAHPVEVDSEGVKFLLGNCP